MEPPDSPRPLARVRDKIRLKHYSIRTEQAYVEWIKRFILFHGKRHPRTLGAAEVEAFLTDLAVARQGCGADAEPGEERAVVPLQGAARHRAAVARSNRECQSVTASAGRPYASGGR
jgi:hypothetical protein